ncbi:hypothetical protein AMATHDRAFT_5592 [Amanita thiersii Skay4041]|uniref:protein-tyrosine-phosphatase n=1 Tax=Amanita thiersii Skay4041 TaxID=703135 RepID=A0A2A9NH78_9AGAR|nr:hypothetical protein AMATHDRAFT_5592 [Amanita thiersii Skay4041]
MDEIIPGLWIGDLPSALNVESLKAHKIFSVLSAMRGRVTVNEASFFLIAVHAIIRTFIRHQISLDDTEDADVLVHLLPAIHFIQAEMDKGRGVLVHCQAGVSRSATIVAAYLMYSRNMDTESALELIKEARPNVEPNQNFLQQLEIFHKAQFRISRKDKNVRMFYMERAAQELLNGDGTLPTMDMFAKFPRSPSDSTPATPGGPRRRIRCKMCRQELAAREHMLDHGQLGPPTPATLTPAGSRRPSSNQSRRPSINQPRSRVGSSSDVRPRRPSMLGFGGLGDTLTMSALDSESAVDDEDTDSGSGYKPPTISHVSHSETDVRRYQKTPPSGLPLISESPSDAVLPGPQAEGGSESASHGGKVSSRISIEEARLLGRSLSDAVLTQVPDRVEEEKEGEEVAPKSAPMTSEVNEKPIAGPLVSPSDLAAQLYANPKLAPLRVSTNSGPNNKVSSSTPMPPILVNAKCSGYFVEPMKWMEPVFEAGEIAGKIVCPNKKCGAKLGNYDWAGVKCGCREWVVPGFCINRSKVDEVIV